MACFVLAEVQMTKATTIDNLDVKIHERYAQDQQIYDRSFVTEASLVSPHADIAATSAIYSSHYEALFEHYRMRNRFFSYTILPFLPQDGERKKGEDEETQEDQEEEDRESILLKKTLQATKAKNQDTSLFEKDKSKIVNLLQTVDHLNEILGQINSRKLQYQKG